MSLILPQTVEVNNTKANRDRYKRFGYDISDLFQEKIIVNVTDLPYRSQILVKIKCDYCGKEDFVLYRDVYRGLNSLICTKLCCNNPNCKKEKAIEVRRINADTKFNFKSTKYRDKDWLYNEYIIKDKSAELISNETGLGLRTVREYINNYSLTTKNGSKTNFITKDELEELYVTQRKTTEEIGNIYNLRDTTIGELLKKFNIPIFSQSEQMLRYYYEKDGKEKKIRYYKLLENRIKASCNARKINIEDFNGFIKSENSRFRGTAKYFEWRTHVFKRDNYTCQCCGQHGGKLQAHHIVNFSSNEELRLNINNGITLCYECHSPCIPNSFHSVFGKQNNSKEQLEEYIKTRRSEVA